MPDDAELAVLAHGGDMEAYGTLVDRHLSGVYAVIRRIVFNSSDAEDLTQDTFVRALTRLDQYGRDFPFRNWLLKIATNLAINHIRSRSASGPGSRGSSRTARTGRKSRSKRRTPRSGRRWLEKLELPGAPRWCCFISRRCPTWRLPK